MAKQLQLRRETADEIAKATGAVGEPWYDITNKDIRINDGTTAGGLPMKNITATGSTTPRMLEDRFGDIINVKDFGAVEVAHDLFDYTNATISNNSVAVQQAITYAKSVNKAVFIPYCVKYSKQDVDDDGVIVIDDSGGIRKKTGDYWYRPYKVNKIRWIAHRGMSAVYPENTVPSFQMAGEMGAYAIETDICWSFDGEPVCIHDTTVDRTTDGTGNVYDFTLEELRGLDAGSWAGDNFSGLQIPTFEEYLTTCRKYGCAPFVEIKTAPNVDSSKIEAIIDIINEYASIESAVILAFSSTYLEYARAYNKNIGICRLKSSTIYTSDIAYLETFGGRVYLGNSYTYFNNDNVKELYKAGIDINPYTITSRAGLEKMLSLGINNITANAIYA